MNDLHKAFNQTALTFCLHGGLGIKDKPSDKDHRFPYRMGMELELERVRKQPDDGIRGWTTHIDESLRDGIEYVTDTPISGGAVVTAVNSFYAAGMSYTGGPRTSTHIHVNMGNDTVEQLRVMFMLSYCLEDAMFQMLSMKRKYCGYCMPLSEMPAWRIRNFLGATDAVNMLQAMGGNNADKYYGFNVNSVRKHGTVEFRYFPGAPTKEELLSWLDYCTQIKRAGLSVTIEGLIDFGNAEVFAAWICRMLPEWGARLVAAVGADSIYSSLQDVLGMLPLDQPQREESIVFVGPVILNLVNKLELPEQMQFDWFKSQAEAIRIMTTGDWGMLLQKARRLKPPIIKKAEDKVRIDYEQAEPARANELANEWRIFDEPMPARPARDDALLAAQVRYEQYVADRDARLRRMQVQLQQAADVVAAPRPAPRPRVPARNIPPARNPRGAF